jgi:CarD family transcriptional regulator
VFHVGDKVVHPMHGAGVVDGIVQKKVAGVMRDYYIMKLPRRSMVVMIPTENSQEIGMRPVMDGESADRVLAAIPMLSSEMTSNWNRRYRENLDRLKSGDLMEVARVVKGLTVRDSKRGLSTGERKMLHSARQILVSELVMSKGLSYEAAENALNMALS